MKQETCTLSQKELQRVTVLSQCVQGNLTCARAAELLDLSPRHIKRLKARYRQARSTIAIPGSIIPTLPEGDIFMLPLG